MNLKQIDPKQLIVKFVDIWKNQGMLLTSGDFKKGHFNTMTVGWGSLGVMWVKPFVQVVVRPTRYTYEFTEKYNNFTLCAFPKEYRKALTLLGTKSGRDSDKIKESDLIPRESKEVSSPGFAEANLIFECKKIYWDDFKPENFLHPNIDKNYPQKDYHRIYFGEVLAIWGTDDYQ
jgi:flavin reductase (DIM6/NTAB) family NADH-FMN oxidoreductase RutF